jgi:L-threonylcarbamoyladenylate synthase
MNMDIDYIVNVLKNNGVVLLPTDTIYGLMCDATNIEAVDKIYRMKNRDYSKPMLILVSNIDMLNKYCKVENGTEKMLIDKYFPGEMTIILKRKEDIPLLVTSGKDTIGVRIPNNKELLSIISKLDRPLVSTSANISNSINITSIDLLDERIKKEADYIYDGGVVNNNASTVVKVDDNKVVILREGNLSQDIRDNFM